jgi:ribosomal protein S18 acetylase RimI-like enzyme
LPPRYGNDLASLIAVAFDNYPLFRFVYHDLDEESYGAALCANFEYYIALTYASGSQVVGAWAGNALVGGMMIWTPEGLEWTDNHDELTERLVTRIGADAFARLKAFDKTMVNNAPDLDVLYHYLDTIAVNPDHQGKGYARDMIEYACERSRSHDQSGAVCLSTEAPNNIPLYEKLGFEQYSVAESGGVETTSFFLRT